MEKNEILLEEKYSNEDILKAVNKLSEEERGALLASLQIPQIRNYLNNPEECKKYCDNLLLIAGFYEQVAEVMEKMKDNIDTLLEDDVKEFSSDYDKLTETERKKVALEMLNNTDFQKNCCEILVKDYKRVVKSDEFLTGLDKLLGLGKYFEKCIQNSIGCDHKYEVE